ncbi:MAG: tRNA (adenosine(37)-N6)-dimethylallyltransferase MiaA [Oceanicaulis sp.]|nr:tRNA (adenosine(37)-N6)-dimethylallyltransferase MiaA [Oceanicaulis sp.]
MLGGPTASGKTALSLHAARRLGAEIINADSMQVYDGLSILTARPSAHELDAAPHHLFGVIDPSRRCSAGRWARMALEVIEDIRSRGRRVILAGGTGLYFKVMLDGLAPAPDIPPDIAAEVQALADAGGLDALRERAEALDPDGAARVKHGDRQRLMRLIAVARAAGRPLSELQAETRPLIDPGAVAGVAILPAREGLYARIEARFDAMMAGGALDEARALAARELDPDLPAMKAVGLPPLLEHLAGRCSLDASIETAKRDTRRYAKRQYTWFSNQHPGWARITRLDPDGARAELDAILDAAFEGAQP